MQAALDFFSNLGWKVVGDPSLINSSWNGPDLVFTQEGRVLAVELKNITGNLDLGTLGKSAVGDYGGSIARLARSSLRFYNSSNPQLRLMCQTVQNAKAGTLENALFASAQKTSPEVQKIFGEVHRFLDGQVITDKAASAQVQQSGIWTQIGAAASAIVSAAKTTVAQIGTALSVNTITPPLPVFIPKGYFDGMTGPMQSTQS